MDGSKKIGERVVMLRGPNADSKRHTTSKSLVSRGTSRLPESMYISLLWLITYWNAYQFPLTFNSPASSNTRMDSLKRAGSVVVLLVVVLVLTGLWRLPGARYGRIAPCTRDPRPFSCRRKAASIWHGLAPLIGDGRPGLSLLIAMRVKRMNEGRTGAIGPAERTSLS
jgi:hypothetical protein